MTVACGCGSALGNFGQPDCVTVISETSRIIIGRAWKADGTRNYIDTATLTAAGFADRFNRYTAAGALVSDDNKLWITPRLENIGDERGDSTYWESDAGTSIKTRDGVRKIAGHIINAAMEVLAEAKKFECTDLCFWEIDNNGTLIGEYLASGTATYLYGVLITPGSWDPQYVKPKPNTPGMLKLMFSVERYELDADLRAVPASAFTASYNLNNVLPLYSITGEKVTCTTTVLTAKIYSGTATGKGYNNLVTPQAVKGLVTADIKVYNATTATEVTPSGVVESAVVDGQYAITFSAQTSTNDLRIRVKKARLDSYALEQVAMLVA